MAGLLASNSGTLEPDLESDEAAREFQARQDARDELEKFSTGEYRAVRLPGLRVDGWDV